MRRCTIVSTLAALIAQVASQDIKPLSIGPSQYFEGNDGPWSTFDIRVGTPEQDIRVLVSTASPQSMVALEGLGCSSGVFSSVPPNCAVSRGNLFNLNKSSSWHDMGQYGINQNGVGLEANLGYEQGAQWGLEHLGIGLTGPAFENQTVAGIATAKPFYLGVLGLNSQPVNFSVLGNYSAPSLLTTLKDQKKIPSLSWSYTAGARYRLKQVFGQLIFSGYDTSRFQANTASFTMAGDQTRDLVVSLQSIAYTGGPTSTSLLTTPINIFIDSTDPNIWLPGDVCDAFERAFNLTLDAKSGLYLVNDSHHNALLASGAQVTFRISDVKAGGDTVAVTLPYGAFDLIASAPLVDASSSYFPLKRASGPGQYTLGRTFLQEAYLSADYERKVFNVSACTWREGAVENIVAIPSKDAPTDSGSGSSSSSSSSSGLSPGAIAGIVVGAVAFLAILILLIVLVILKKRREWIRTGYKIAAPSKRQDTTESVLHGPVFNSGSLRSKPGGGDSSTPFSADDVSGGPRSTLENSRSGTTAGSSSGGGSAAGGGESSGRGGAELEAGEVVVGKSALRPMPPVDENGGLYELPGEEVKSGVGSGVSPAATGSGSGSGSADAATRSSSNVGTRSSSVTNKTVSSSTASSPVVARPRRNSKFVEERDDDEHTTSTGSPVVSTLGSTLGGTWRDGERPNSQLVSPISPTRPTGNMPF